LAEKVLNRYFFASLHVALDLTFAGFQLVEALVVPIIEKFCCVNFEVSYENIQFISRSV